MEKTNHPVDNLFSKGIEGFQMEPSPEIKKKVFASPAAIKPIKPWFVGINGIIITVSVIATASLIIYFGLFNNIQSNNTPDLNKDISTNDILQNEKSNIESENNISLKNEKEVNSVISIENSSTPNTQTVNKQLKEANVERPINDAKTNNKIAQNNETGKSENFNSSLRVPQTDIKNIEGKQSSENNNSSIKTDQLTSSLIVDKSITNNQIKENKVSDLSNNIGTNENYNLSISSSNNLESKIDKSLILFFLDKKTIQLSSQQIAEYMILFSEKPAHFNKGLWFAEIKVGAAISKYNVTANSDEWKPASEAKQEILKPSNDFELGANVVYQQNRLILKGGLNYVNYGEKLSGHLLLTNPYNSEQIVFNNNYYETIINGNYYDIDTLGSYTHYTYTQTDHIFVSDSSQAYNTQNVLVDMYDTTNVTKFDTLPKNTFYNSIRYMEIPLSIGYVFPLGRFNLALSANITPGYILAVRGSQMNAENYPALEPYNKSTLRKFTLSAGVSFELGYMLNESLTLIAEPYYKRSLLPMYSSKNNINQTSKNFGFRIGVRKLL